MNRAATALLAAALLLWGCGDAGSPDAGAGRADDVPAASPWPPPADDVAVLPDLLTVNYYVVLDGSGSMKNAGCSEGRAKLRAAKQVLREFSRALPAEVNLGLLAFDSRGVGERVSLGASPDAFGAVVEQVEAGGSTPLRTAITLAYESLTRQAQQQLGYGEYHLVVVTDGKASNREDPTDVVNRILAESSVVLHTVGFCIDDDHSLNQRGRTLYRTAQSADELRAGLEQVLAEAPSFTVTRF
ncbi:MAG: VWA domain-containing protein [Myxococcota bacterium]|nr:VWA domain-containing protein [Myxococcota bacterium]